MMNIAGGNKYDLGAYHTANESWTTLGPPATIDSGPNANWMVGQFAGDRFMNIGWSTGGPPMLSTVRHVSQQPASPFGSVVAACEYTKTWEVRPEFACREFF
jgi:hypothetical protein